MGLVPVAANGLPPAQPARLPGRFLQHGPLRSGAGGVLPPSRRHGPPGPQAEGRTAARRGGRQPWLRPARLAGRGRVSHPELVRGPGVQVSGVRGSGI